MNVRIVAITMVVGVSTGCLIPVDVTRDDAGITQRQDSDAGGSSDAGSIDGGCSTDFGTGAAGQVAVVSLAGCGHSSVVVHRPDGGVLSERTTGDQTAFTPDEPGVYVLDVTIDGGTKQVPFPVDGLPNAAFDRRYVDRMDRCNFLFITDHQRVVCSVGYETWIYDIDGTVHAHFSGMTFSGVMGDEIWSVYEHSVEHRTDTDAGVRFDARYEDAVLNSTIGPFTGWLAAGSFALTSERVDVGFGFVRIDWNGTTLDAGFRAPLLGFFRGTDAYGVVMDGDEVWDTNSCRVEPGCTMSACDPIRTCAQPRRILLGSEEDRLWALSDTTLELLARPLSHPTVLASRTPPTSLVAPRERGFGAPAILGDQRGGPFVVPIAQNGSFFFASVPSSDFRTATPHWIIVKLDPFTLRFIPR